VNYPIPYSQANTAYFYANSTNNIGSFNKPIDGRVQLSIDYSKLVPAVTVSKVWFEISPGGVPQLTIDSVVTTSTLLTFFVAGGYSDMSYDIIINAVLSDGSIHSDLLVVNVFGENGCACACITSTYADNYIQFGNQEVFINKYPRFFVSGIAPTNANLLDRWYDLNNQTWYDYVTDGMTNFWAVSGVGTPAPPTGGTDSGVTGNITIKKMKPLALDGVTTTFPLISIDMFTPNVTTNNSLFVSMDGVWQEPTTQYTASGSSITFATAPAADSYVFILWIFGGITSG
jgi:hypothetical protein